MRAERQIWFFHEVFILYEEEHININERKEEMVEVKGREKTEDNFHALENYKCFTTDWIAVEG
jgi:hypothetical protein